MASITLPAEGGCRCGRLRFVVTAPPLLTSACHCRGCQRMTASAYSLSLAVPTSGFAVTRGEPMLGGCRSPKFEHWHCGWCKSWVHTVPQPDAGFINVRATMLDDPHWFAPYVELQTAEQLPFATTGAVRSFARFPAMEEWPQLIAEYAAAG